jgi:hypothetical protein
MTAVPDMDAVAAGLAAGPGVLTSAVWLRSRAHGVLAISNHRSVSYRLFSQQQRTHQRTWAD